MLYKDDLEIFTAISLMPVFEDKQRYKGSIAVVTDITEQVLARRQLERRVAERTRELTMLLELSHEISTSQGLETLLNQILERLKTIVDYRCSAIIMLEEEHWQVRAGWPAGSGMVEDLLLSEEERHTLAQAFESEKTLLLDNPLFDEEQSQVLQGLSIRLSNIFFTDGCSWLGVPLLRKDRLIGLLMLACTGRDEFSDEQMKVVVAFANQAAIVIENNQLLDQVQAAAAARERNRLAQELHDSVTQTLFTASVLAEATPRIWDKDQEIARQNMEKLSVLIRGALAEIRSLLFELRSGGLSNLTLGQLLTTMVEGARARTRAAISVSLQDDLTLPENVTLAFYRIAQEALNNGINHAGASQVNISLSEEPGWVELRIQDNGCGFDPQIIPAGHLGISIIRERATQIGGDLRIQSEPGLGTEISVTWSNGGESVKHD